MQNVCANSNRSKVSTVSRQPVFPYSVHQQVFKNCAAGSMSTVEFLKNMQASIQLLEQQLGFKVIQWISYNFPVIVCRGSVEQNSDGHRQEVCAKFSLCHEALRKEAEILFHLEETCSENCHFFPRVLFFTELQTQAGSCLSSETKMKTERSGETVFKPSALFTEWVGTASVAQIFQQNTRARVDTGEIEWDIRNLATQLIFVLLYLRRARVVSRDIKPSNLLWNRDFRVLYICDFDLGEKQPEWDNFADRACPVDFSVAGTPGFIRPQTSVHFEVKNSSERHETQTTFRELYKNEVFSSAVTLASLLAQVPESKVHRFKLHQLMEKAAANLHIQKRKAFTDLISSMVDYDGSEAQLKAMLCSEFLCHQPSAVQV